MTLLIKLLSWSFYKPTKNQSPFKVIDTFLLKRVGSHVSSNMEQHLLLKEKAPAYPMLLDWVITGEKTQTSKYQIMVQLINFLKLLEKFLQS